MQTPDLRELKEFESEVCGRNLAELDAAFRSMKYTESELALAYNIMERILIYKEPPSNIVADERVDFAVYYIFTRVMKRINREIDGGSFITRFCGSFIKGVDLAKSKDKKQRRIAIGSFKSLNNSIQIAVSTKEKAEYLCLFVESFEELPSPRKGKKIRIKADRGRPMGAGSYKQSDRELLQNFKEKCGRLPKFDAEYKALAEVARGKDSGHAYDRSSTISRLRRAATALRRE